MSIPYFTGFVQVINTAMKQQVRFEEMRFISLEEAKKYKEDLIREYGAIGCHKVRLFMEVFPESEEDEEFDEDEMEAEEIDE